VSSVTIVRSWTKIASVLKQMKFKYEITQHCARYFMPWNVHNFHTSECFVVILCQAMECYMNVQLLGVCKHIPVENSS
jgi:hypothetical protein